MRRWGRGKVARDEMGYHNGRLGLILEGAFRAAMISRLAWALSRCLEEVLESGLDGDFGTQPGQRPIMRRSSHLIVL